MSLPARHRTTPGLVVEARALFTAALPATAASTASDGQRATAQEAGHVGPGPDVLYAAAPRVSQPAPLDPVADAGVLEGGNHGVSPYLEVIRAWAPAVRLPRQDLLTADFRRLTAAAVDAARVGLTCRGRAHLTTDTAMTLRVRACGGTWDLAPGTTTLVLARPGRTQPSSTATRTSLQRVGGP